MVTEKSSNTSLILSFLAGATTSAVALLVWKSKQKEDRVNGTSGLGRVTNVVGFVLTRWMFGRLPLLSAVRTVVEFFHGAAGAVVEGNDLSLFYGNVDELTTITDQRKFLPRDVYSKMVLDAVVCCVDCLIVRTNASGTNKECLLVERSSEPVKGVWWLPGGRMFKGETFFAAALRKAQQETGLTRVTPIQVLGVWNTFFPTSHWDTETEKGTQTVNAVVLVELNDPGADVKLDETSEQWRWIPLSPEAAEKNGEDRYVLQALLRLKAWHPTYDC